MNSAAVGSIQSISSIRADSDLFSGVDGLSEIPSRVQTACQAEVSSYGIALDLAAAVLTRDEFQRAVQDEWSPQRRGTRAFRTTLPPLGSPPPLTCPHQIPHQHSQTPDVVLPPDGPTLVWVLRPLTGISSRPISRFGRGTELASRPAQSLCSA